MQSAGTVCVYIEAITTIMSSVQPSGQVSHVQVTAAAAVHESRDDTFIEYNFMLNKFTMRVGRGPAVHFNFISYPLNPVNSFSDQHIDKLSRL